MTPKLGTIVALTTLALGAGAITVAVAADQEVKSKVKITEGGPDHFEGKVTSKNDKCLAKRKVQLTYSQGAHKGEVLATDRTDSQGRWAIDMMFFAGMYQAIVLERVINAHLTCLGGRSLRAQF